MERTCAGASGEAAALLASDADCIADVAATPPRRWRSTAGSSEAEAAAGAEAGVGTEAEANEAEADEAETDEAEADEAEADEAEADEAEAAAALVRQEAIWHAIARAKADAAFQPNHSQASPRLLITLPCARGVSAELLAREAIRPRL